MHGWNVIKRAIGSFSLASHESTTLATEPYAVALCDRIDLWLKSGHLNEIPAIFHFWSARTHEEKEKWKNSKKKKSLDVFVRGSKVIDTISVTIEQTKLIHNERFDKKKPNEIIAQINFSLIEGYVSTTVCARGSGNAVRSTLHNVDKNSILNLLFGRTYARLNVGTLFVRSVVRRDTFLHDLFVILCHTVFHQSSRFRSQIYLRAKPKWLFSIRRDTCALREIKIQFLCPFHYALQCTTQNLCNA